MITSGLLLMPAARAATFHAGRQDSPQSAATSPRKMPPTSETSLSPAAAGEVRCELHVWPSASLRTVLYGWTHGGTVDGSLKGRKGYPSVPGDILLPEQQIRIFHRATLPTILGLNEYELVTHDVNPSNTEIRNTPGPITPSASPCYSEIIVQSVALQEDFAQGRFIHVIYRMRLFNGPAKPSFVFATHLTTKLKEPRNVDPDDSPRRLTLAAEAAFERNIVEFSAKAKASIALAQNSSKGESK